MSAPFPSYLVPSAALSGLLAFASLVTWLPNSGAADTKVKAPRLIEDALLDEAKSVLATLHKRGIKNVGTLKFQTLQDGKPSDKDNLLASRLADRLEVALVMAMPKEYEIGVVKNAGAAAKAQPKDKPMDYRTSAGLANLFQVTHTLNWGNPPKQVKVDAYLTGRFYFRPNLDELAMCIDLYTPKNTKPEMLTQFLVRTTTGLLTEGGVSLVRSVKSRSLKAIAPKGMVAKTTKAVNLEIGNSGPSVNPSDDPGNLLQSSPIKLEMFYDNQPVNIQYIDGRYQADKAPSNCQVHFRLTRAVEDNVTYGVDLRINGEATLNRFKGHPADVDNLRWILEPNCGVYTIDGFYMKPKNGSTFELLPFRVLGAAESKLREIDYGSDVGQITFHVLRSGLPSVVPSVPPVEGIASNTNNTTPTETPETPPTGSGASETGDLFGDWSSGGTTATADEEAPRRFAARSYVARGILPNRGTPVNAQSHQTNALGVKNRSRSSGQETGLIVPGQPAGQRELPRVPFNNPQLERSIVIHYYQPGQ